MNKKTRGPHRDDSAAKDADVVAATANATYVTVDEAAAILRIGRNLVYQAIERGEMPGVRKIGKVIRIRRATLVDDDY
jgi:excisionase family DNA binding protein